MRAYYDVKQRLTAMAMALMMTMSSVTVPAYADELPDTDAPGLSAEESMSEGDQTYGLDTDVQAPEDNAGDGIADDTLIDVGEGEAAILPDEEEPVADDAAPDTDTTSEDDGILIEDVTPAGKVLVYSSDALPGMDEDVPFTIEIEGKKDFDDGQFAWADRISGDDLANVSGAVATLIGSSDAEIDLPLNICVKNGDDTESDITDKVTVRLYTDDIEIMEQDILAHETENSWEIMPFDFHEAKEGEPAFISFKTDYLSSFVFVNTVDEDDAPVIVSDVDDSIVIEDTVSDVDDGIVIEDIVSDAETEAEVAESDDSEQPVSETIEEPVETEPVSKAETETVTETLIEETEPETETHETEPVTESVTEPDTEMATEAATEQITESEESVSFETESVTEAADDVLGNSDEEIMTEADTEAETEAEYLSGELTYENDDVILKVTVSEENRIPAGAVLCVEAINESSDTYRQYFEDLMSFYGVSEDALFILPYDVHFELDGEEIEPQQGDVSVDFELKTSVGVSEEETASVVHITDNGDVTEVVENADNGSGEITNFDFTVDSFSGIVIAKLGETRGLTTVTFNPTGGILSDRTMQAELGVTTAESLPVPTKAGHIFLGWYSQREGGDKLEEGDVFDRTLYFAQWREITYTLVLHPNGTDDEPIEYELTYRQAQELTDTVFELDGYVLGSWNTSRFGTGTSYPSNTTLSHLTDVDGDTVTLYAIWSDTPYSITFDEQGGSEVPDIIVAEGQAAGTKMIPSMKEGYTFLGWFTRPTDGVEVKSDTPIYRDYYLYATFGKNPVVTFDPNDDNAVIAEKDRVRNLVYGGAVGELPSVTNGAKDFIGWFTRAYGGTQISSGAIVYADTTYYAHYGYKPYFDTAGGKITTPDRNQAKQSPLYKVTSFPVVKRDGYMLEGWYLPDGETRVNLNDIVDLSEDKRIVAHWIPSDKATVTLNYDGGTANPRPSSLLVYKNRALEQLPMPTRSGYKFMGWYDADDNLYQKGTVVTDDVALTARWTQKNVTLTFDAQGGEQLSDATMAVPEGSTVTVVPGAQKDGFLLMGWYTEPEGQGDKLTTSTVITEDATYYAYWVPKNEYIDESGLKYTYTAYWNNVSNSQVRNSDNRLVFTPTSSNDVTARLYVNFELEKTVNDLSLPAGALEVRVPKYVWKDWSGNNVGSTNIGDLFVMAPDIPENDYFNYYEEPDYYVITNCVPLNGGAGFLKEFEYTVSPLDVRGGAKDINGDFVDGYRYFDNTVNVSVKIDKELDGVYDTTQRKQLSLEMHTELKPYSSKLASYINYQWDPSWGNKPSDAEDYFYVVWVVTNRGNTSSTQGGTYSITEANTTHDGTIVYDNFPTNATYYIDGANYDYTVVTKHPRELLNDAVLNPITIHNEAIIKDVWKSGYTTERRVNAQTKVSVIEHPVGEFDKKNYNNVTLHGGQEKIVTYGQEVYIPFYTVYDGGSNIVPSWDPDTHTYTTATRRMMIQDGRPGDLKYSSGMSDPRYAWDANVKDGVLDDNDYVLKSIYIELTEYDSEQIDDKWLTPWAHTDKSTFKPMSVYVRYRGDDHFTFYKSVDMTTSSYASVSLPDNVVGYRVEHDSNFFKTKFYVRGAWYLEPTSRIYSLIADDVDHDATSIIKNQANCKLWFPQREGVPDTVDLGEEHAFFDVTAWRYYELNISKDSLYCSKYIGPATVDAATETQTSQVKIAGWNYNNSGTVFRTDTGTMYDLLPRGVSVNRDTIRGYAITSNRTWYGMNYSSYGVGSELNANYYNVRFVDDWEGSGRTMMIIDFVIPKGIYACGAEFRYDMIDTYSNIAFYGTARENDVAYVNTSTITREISSVTSDIGIVTDAEVYEGIDNDHKYVAYARDDTEFKGVISETWGFDKSVKTETTTGYVFDGATPLDEDYTYKLHMAQSENSEIHNLIIYDVLEAGTDLIGSEWLGSFVSADASDFATVVNKGEGVTATCAPVIYYSTKPRDEFPEMDQNFSMEGTEYDLDDTSIWSTSVPDDPGDVTAVAFDMRTDTDGNPMIFAGKKNLSVYIRMHSPANTELVEKVNGNAAVMSAFRASSGDTTYEHSEASVRIIDDIPELHKTSNPASGTQEEPAKVAVEEPLAYTLSVKNTGTDYIMKDIVVEDEIPEGLEVQNIQVHFGTPSAAINIEDSPRVSMTEDGRHKTFTIARLGKQETCYIVINTIVKVEESSFVNGSTITSVNGIDRHIESEITYHDEENSMEVEIRKENDSRQLLAGVVLQILDAEENVVEQWTSTSAVHKVRLFPGTYTLHEVSAPDHFRTAEDIPFEVTQDKYLKVNGTVAPNVKMVDVETVDVSGQKYWVGDGNGASRPESLTANLLRDGEVIDTKTLTAADQWKYEWTDLEKYREPGREYIYQVLEEEVPEGYTFFDGADRLGSPGLEFVFAPGSATESTSCDWIYFYYQKNGVWYRTNKYGGSNLGGQVVSLPSEMVYIDFRSDRSVSSAGFSFSSIRPCYQDVWTSVSSTSLPSGYTNYGTYIGDSWPSYRNCGHNQQRRWTYKLNSDSTWPSATPIVNNNGPQYNMINAKPTPVKIAKVGESSNILPGAEMLLTGTESISGRTVSMSITSQEELETVELFPGSYTLHEVTAPAGYYKNSDATFTISNQGRISFSGVSTAGADICIRDYKTRYNIRKYNRNGSYLSGCTFQLWREADVLDPDSLAFATDAEPVYEWTTASGSESIVGLMNSGENYWLIETDVPEGYEVLAPYFISVPETATTNSTITVSLYNEWEPVEFEVSKKNFDDEYVAGARLKLTGTQKTGSQPNVSGSTTFTEEWVSTTEPKHFSLKPGTYYLTETSRPDSNLYLKTTEQIRIYVTEAHTVYYYTTHGGTTASTYVESADIVLYDDYNKTSLPFTKVWNDIGYESNRPSSITFELYQNGVKYRERTLTAEDVSDDGYKWEGVFEDLPILDPDDKEYEYEINEIADVEHYRTTYNSSETSGMLVTFSGDSDLGDGSMSLLVKRGSKWYQTVMLDVTDLDSAATTTISGDHIGGKTIYVPTKGTDGRVAIKLSESTKSRNFTITQVTPTSAVFEGRNGVADTSFNETQITSVWNAAGYPHLEESGAQPAECILFTSAGSSESFVGADIITNTSLATSVELLKMWEDGGDVENRPESITLDLYNENDLETILDTVVLTAADADGRDVWTRTVTNLPQFNADGSVAKYLYKEREVDGYRTFYSKSDIGGVRLKLSDDSTTDGGVLNFIVPDRTRSANNYLYQNGVRDFTEVAGLEIFVPFYTDYHDMFLSLKDAGENASIKIESVTPVATDEAGLVVVYGTFGETAESGYFSGENVEVLTGNGVIRYRYFGESDTSSSGCYVVNESSKTSVIAKKQWQDDGHEDERPESITVEVVNELDPDTVVREVVLSGTDDTWEVEVQGLDRYNEDGSVAHYLVREKEAVPNYTAFYENADNTGFLLKFAQEQDFAGTVTFYGLRDDRNFSSVVSLNGKKNLSAEDIAGKEIYIEKGSFNGFAFRMSSSAATNVLNVESVEAVNIDAVSGVNSYSSSYSGSFNPVSATRVTGSSFTTADFAPVIYGVYEYSSGKTEPYYGSSIVNRYDRTSVSVTKEWDGDNEEDRPESVTFNLFNAEDMETVIDTAVVTLPDSEATFNNLPKYDADGNVIRYVVVEEPVEDYVSYYASASDDEAVGFFVEFERQGSLSALVIQDGLSDAAVPKPKMAVVGVNGTTYAGSLTGAGGRYFVPFGVNEDGSVSKAFMLYGSGIKVKNVELAYDPALLDTVCKAPWSVSYIASIYNMSQFTGSDYPDYASLGRETDYAQYGASTYVYMTYVWSGREDPVAGDVVVTNKKFTKDVPFKKIFDDEGYESFRPETVTIYLKDSEGNTIDQQELEVTGSEIEGVFENLPYFDDEGNEIHYHVEEDVPANYKAFYSMANPKGFWVTFSDDTDLKSATMYLLANPAGFSDSTSSYDSSSNVSFTAATRTGTSLAGKTVYIPINSNYVETDINPYFGIYLNAYTSATKAARSRYAVTNVTLADSPAAHIFTTSETRTYPLYYFIRRTGYDYPSSEKSMGCYDYNYSYDLNIYEWSPSAAPFDGCDIIYNRIDKTQFEVTKDWEVFDESTPSSVTVDLYDADDMATPVATKVIATTEKVSVTTFDDLPKYKEDGSLIVYTAKERAVEGYKPAYGNSDFLDGSGGLYVTFSDDTYLGTNGYVVLYTNASPAHSNGNHYYYYTDDIRGKTVFVPTQSFGDSNLSKPSELYVYYSYSGSSADMKLKITDISWGYQDTADNYIYSSNWSAPSSSSVVLGSNEGFDSDEYSKLASSGYYLTFRLNTDTEKAVNWSCEPGSNYIYNKVDKVDVPYSKTWDDAGFEEYRPSTVTFRAYNANDLETEVAHVDLSTDDDIEGVFEGLPKYNEDGTEAVYTIVEDAVEGYRQTYSLDSRGKKPTGFKVTISEDTYLTDGYLSLFTNTGYIRYTNGNTNYSKYRDELAGQTIFMRSHEVSGAYGFYLYYYAGGNNSSYAWDASKIGKQHFQVANVEPDYRDEVGGYYYPFYSSYGFGRTVPVTRDYHELNEWFNMTYGNSYMGYVFDDVPEPMAGLGHITNHIEMTDVEFTKSWQNETDTAQRPESITVDLYKEGSDEPVDTLVLSGSATSGKFENLPKCDSEGNEIRYYVKERPVPGYATRYAVDDSKVNGFYVTFSDDFNWPGSSSYLTLGCRYSTSGSDDVFTQHFLYPYGKYAYARSEMLAGRRIFIPFDLSYNADVGYNSGSVGMPRTPGEPHMLGLYICLNNGSTRDITGSITDISLGYEPNKNRYVLGATNSNAYYSTIYIAKNITPLRGRHYPNLNEVFNSSFSGWGNSYQYAYIKYIWEDDAYGSFTPSVGATNIVNVYEPYTVTKRWEDEGYEDERPETVSLTFYDPENPSDAVLTKSFAVSDEDEQEYIVNELPVQRDDGTYIKYLVEEDEPEGYVAKYSLTDIKGFWLDFDPSVSADYVNNSSNYLTFASDIITVPTSAYNQDYREFPTSKSVYMWNSGSTHDGGYTYLYAKDLDRPIFIQKTANGNFDGFLLYANNSNYRPNWQFKVDKITPVRRDITYEGSLSAVALNNTYYTNFTGMAKAHLKGDEYPDSSRYYYQMYEWEPSLDYTKVPDCNLIINEIDKTSIPVKKTWDDEGHTDKRPSTLTFDVYNVRDMDTVVKTETVSVDDAGSYSIDDLPKYNDDKTKAQYKLVERKTGYYEPSYEIYGMGEAPDGWIIKLSNDTVVRNGFLSVFPLWDSFYARGRMIDKYCGHEFGSTSYPAVWSDVENTTVGSRATNRYIYVPNSSGSKANIGFMLYISSWDSKNKVSVESVEPVYGSLEQYGYLGKYLLDHYFVNGEPYTTSYSHVYSFYNACELNGHIGTGENIAPQSGSGYNSYWLYRWNPDEDDYNYQNNPAILVRPRAYRVRNKYVPKQLKVEKEWDDDGYEDDRPESISFVVKADGTKIQDVVLTEEDAVDDYHWEKALADLPRYNDDGSEIVYTIEETVPDGYHVSYGLRKVKGLLVTFDADTAVWDGGYTVYSAQNGLIGSKLGYLQVAGHTGADKTMRVPVGGYTYYIPVEDAADSDTVDFVISGSHMNGGHIAISDIKPVYYDDPDFSYLSTTSYAGEILTNDTTAEVFDWYYGNGDLQLYNKTMGPAGESEYLTKKYIRVHKPTEWVEGTSFVNSRVRVPFDKIWDDGGVEELRPDSITVSLYNVLDMDTPVATKEFDVVNGEVQDAYFDDMPRYNDDGTLIEWTVREAAVDDYITRYVGTETPRGFYITFSDDTVMYGTDKLSIYSGLNYPYQLGRMMGAQPYYANPDITRYEAKGNTFYVKIAPGRNTNISFPELQIVSTFADPRSKYEVVSIVPDFDGDLESTFVSSYDPLMVDASRPLRTVMGAEYPASTSSETVRWIWKGGMQIINEADKVRLHVSKYWDDAGYADLRPDSVKVDVKNGSEVVETLSLLPDDGWSRYTDYLPKYDTEGNEIEYTIEEHDVPGYVKTEEGAGRLGFRVVFSEDTNVDRMSLYGVNSECGDRVLLRDSSRHNSGISSMPLSSDLAGAVVYIPINDDPISTVQNARPVKGFMMNVSGPSDSTDNAQFEIESIELVHGVPDDATIVYTYGDTISSSYPKDYCDRRYFNDDYPQKVAGDNVHWIYYEMTDEDIVPASSTNTIKKWPVSIEKVNDIGAFVAGASLEIKRKKTGAVVETFETNSTGALNVMLPAGTYVIHETYTPAGYASLTDDIEFVIASDGTVKVDSKAVDSVEVLNRELVKISGQKTWSGDDAADRPESITVNLYANGTKVQSVTTTASADWKYDFGQLERYDENGDEIEYTVDEEIVRGYGREVTNGTTVDTTQNNVGVKIKLDDISDIGDGTLEIYYTKDSKWYKITVDAPIGGKTIYVPTYVFFARVVLNSTDIRYCGVIPQDIQYVSGQRTAGELLSEAPSYTANATSASFIFGNIISSSAYTKVTLGNTDDHEGLTDDIRFLDHDAAITNGIENIKLPDPFDVSFKKVDTQGTMLAGAEFTVTGREDGAHYDIIPVTFTSSADEVTVKSLRPGTYHLNETKSPAGCLRELRSIDFTVGEDGTVTIGNDEVDVVSMTDAETVFKVKKIDKDTGDPIPGAVFQILTSDRSVVTEWTTTGEVKEFHGILDVETDYILHEKTAPAFYLPVPDLQFSLNPDGSVNLGDNVSDYLEIDTGVLNILESKRQVKFRKLNENGDTVAGAQFTLSGTDSSTFTRTWVSGSSDHVVTDIAAGQYVLSETAPTGYDAVSNVTLTVAKNGAVSVTDTSGEGVVEVDDTDVSLVIVTNHYSRHKLSVSKTVTGNFGNKSKSFNFVLTLTEKTGGAHLPEKVTGVKTLENGTKDTAEYTIGDSGTIEFSLTHGVSIEFSNIPYGVTYKVEETSASSDGYEVSYTNNSGTVTQDISVSCVNRKDSIIPTRAEMNNILWVLLVALLLAGWIWFRRKDREENSSAETDS